MSYVTFLILLTILGHTVAQSASYIQPPDDLCVRNPCVYEENVTLATREWWSFRLDDVGAGDEISGLATCDGQQQACIDNLSILFLPSDQFDAFSKNQPYKPDTGSVVPGSATPTPSPSGESQLEPYGWHRIQNDHDNYYMCAVNSAPFPLTILMSVTYKGAGCLDHILAFVPFPIILLLAGLIIYIQKARNMKTHDELMAIAPDAEEKDSCTDCCSYDLSRDPGPPRYAGCTSHRLPHWDWIGGFPAFLWTRPTVSFSGWWRQQVLLTWPWNPPSDEVLSLSDRKLYMIMILAFNLLVQTVWSQVVFRANARLSRRLPVFGDFATRYLGSALLQNAFWLLFKPVLTVGLAYAPQWKRSASRWTVALGYVANHGFSLFLLFFSLGVIWAGLSLANGYRCGVLGWYVLLPFVVTELARMLFVFAVIPLPLWYIVVCCFGSVDPAAMPLLSRVGIGAGEGGEEGEDGVHGRDGDAGTRERIASISIPGEEAEATATSAATAAAEGKVGGVGAEDIDIGDSYQRLTGEPERLPPPQRSTLQPAQTSQLRQQERVEHDPTLSRATFPLGFEDGNLGPI